MNVRFGKMSSGHVAAAFMFVVPGVLALIGAFGAFQAFRGPKPVHAGSVVESRADRSAGDCEWTEGIEEVFQARESILTCVDPEGDSSIQIRCSPGDIVVAIGFSDDVLLRRSVTEVYVRGDASSEPTELLGVGRDNMMRVYLETYLVDQLAEQMEGSSRLYVRALRLGGEWFTVSIPIEGAYAAFAAGTCLGDAIGVDGSGD